MELESASAPESQSTEILLSKISTETEVLGISRAYDHSFISDGLGTEDEKRRPRSDNDYEREVHKMASTLRSVDGKTNILVDGQKKGHEKLDTISTQQAKDGETWAA